MLTLDDLPHRAKVEDVVRRAGTGGAWPEAKSTRADDVPCRRSPAGFKDVQQALDIGVAVTHAVYFLPDQEVERDDLVTISGPGITGAVEHVVRLVLTPSEPVYRKALCEERQAGA